jgi:hypothetical protein
VTAPPPGATTRGLSRLRPSGAVVGPCAGAAAAANTRRECAHARTHLVALQDAVTGPVLVVDRVGAQHLGGAAALDPKNDGPAAGGATQAGGVGDPSARRLPFAGCATHRSSDPDARYTPSLQSRPRVSRAKRRRWQTNARARATHPLHLRQLTALLWLLSTHRSLGTDGSASARASITGSMFQILISPSAAGQDRSRGGSVFTRAAAHAPLPAVANRVPEGCTSIA